MAIGDGSIASAYNDTYSGTIVSYFNSPKAVVYIQILDSSIGVNLTEKSAVTIVCLES